MNTIKETVKMWAVFVCFVDFTLEDVHLNWIIWLISHSCSEIWHDFLPSPLGTVRLSTLTAYILILLDPGTGTYFFCIFVKL